MIWSNKNTNTLSLNVFLLTLVIFVFAFAFPLVASAQLGGLVPCEGTDCGPCHVVLLGQNIISFLIGVSVFIAVGLFVYAGFIMVTAGGDPGKVSRSKGIFASVAIGLILVLVAWLAIDTLMKNLFNQDAFGPWNKLECSIQPDVTFVREGSAPGADPVDPSTRPGGTGTRLTHEEVSSRLSEAGVSVSSSGGCSDPSISTCTGLEGMRSATANQVVNIAEGCSDCSVIVTGGTEAGHAAGDTSHAGGFKVDIDDNAVLDSYLQSKLTPAGRRTGSHGGPRYIDSCGNEYVRESNHWDVTVYGTSCTL